MSLLRKIQQLPLLSKFILNRYAPYRGAGIVIDEMDFANYHVRVKMPLTRKNQNIVGVHFGGSLYSMVDPFYMLLLMHHLGPKYIVWDKSSTIQFLAPGRGTVYADIRISKQEVQTVKELAIVRFIASISLIFMMIPVCVSLRYKRPFISALNRAKASLEKLNNEIE